MSQIIISLKSHYAELVLSGEKTVELRNRPVRLEKGTKVWIYEVRPKGCIVATAKVRAVSHGSPYKIWKDFGKKIGMRKKDFDEYMKGKTSVSAIVLGAVRKLRPCLTLENIRESEENFHPPQFYKCLSQDEKLFEILNAAV